VGLRTAATNSPAPTESIVRFIGADPEAPEKVVPEPKATQAPFTQTHSAPQGRWPNLPLGDRRFFYSRLRSKLKGLLASFKICRWHELSPTQAIRLLYFYFVGFNDIENPWVVAM